MIRFSLLSTWLNNSDIDFNLDTSLVIPVAQTKSTNASDESEPNLARWSCITCEILSLVTFKYFRAIYLCNSSEFWPTYLIKIALSEDNVDTNPTSEQCNYLFKSRALKCLCAVTDEETIVKLTKGSYTEFL